MLLEAPGLTEEQFLALCEKFPDATVEYTEDGTVIVMPPTDPRSSARGAQVVRQLGNWAEEQKRGMVLGPDAGFFFPRGSRRSPDGTWFDEKRYAEAEKQSKLLFPVFAPDFVIEVRSPSDRVKGLRKKMREYVAEIYRPGRDVERLENPVSVTGEGPVAGFTMLLDRVFTAC